MYDNLSQSTYKGTMEILVVNNLSLGSLVVDFQPLIVKLKRLKLKDYSLVSRPFHMTTDINHWSVVTCRIHTLKFAHLPVPWGTSHMLQQ